jgi:hypothetical protein
MGQGQFPISLKILECGDGVVQIGKDFLPYVGPNNVVDEE